MRQRSLDRAKPPALLALIEPALGHFGTDAEQHLKDQVFDPFADRELLRDLIDLIVT
jgi:hypothetical protein